MEKYKDSRYAPEVRAKDLLEKMSIDEKMAQIVGMLCGPVSSKDDIQMIRMLFPHGVGQVSGLTQSILGSLAEVRKAQRIIQDMIMEQSEHHIPAVFHNEGLCGASVSGGAVFASGIGRGASFDIELEEKIGEIIAKQTLAAGFTQSFCPVLDIARDPRHGRHGEAYGEDPTHVAAMGVANVKGQQKPCIDHLQVNACAKHYMAYHMSTGGINAAHVEIGPRNLREIHGKPFQAVIKKTNLHAIMPCYDSFDEGPVSSSKEMLTTILRDEMGFEGTTVSDYGAIKNVHQNHHIGETLEEAGYKSLFAGMDMELPMPAAFGEGLKQMFIDGKADISVLDGAVLRILIEKFRMGVFENPYGIDEEIVDVIFDDSENKEISLRSARESLVLLKNNGVLPLKNNIKKIAIIGPHANWANYYFGGYSRLSGLETSAAAATSQAGFDENNSSNKNSAIMIPGTKVQFCETEVFKQLLKKSHPECKTIVEMLKDVLPEAEIVYAHGYHVIGNCEDDYEEAINICRNADVILLTLGGKNASGSIATTGEGVDTVNINLPACQDNFIIKAKELGLPMIGIHFDGRPISSDAADLYLDAIIEAWNPGTYAANAVTEMLFGDYNPSGKMPVTTARLAGQIPVYYNHPHGSAWSPKQSVGFEDYIEYTHKPRYYFGYGLSYTTFSYSHLEIEMKDNCVQIEFDLTNTGNVKGTEVVQLYYTDPYASMIRPVQELAGFTRVELEPCETKKISFTLYLSQLAFLDENMQWKIEHGKVEVGIGGSSIEHSLRGSFNIESDAYINGKEREFYASVHSE
jgi:Beta-glucosidase-related glycosidases